jgi:hypothetical protein
MTQGILARIFPIEDMKQTALRFPLSILSSVGLFIIAIFMIHEVIDDDAEIIGKIAVTLSCGYFFFGAAKLMEESGGIKQIVTVPAFLAAAVLLSFSPHWMLYLYFISPVLLLLIMVAPFAKNRDDLSFWFFNRMTWFGVAVAILASVIFAGGLAAALASIDYLFGVEIPGELYGDLWAFTCLIFGPIYALTWVPEKFHFTREDCNDPPGLAFLLNWVMAPLVLLYLLILYAYLAKILITMEIPRGQLSYMIAGFGGVGVVTYLLGWPIKDEGGLLLKLVYRIFFPALIVPVGMQFYAIGERIGAYGITEQRAFIVICALWFAVLAIGFTWQKFSLRMIPFSLAVLMLIGMVTVNIAGYDQQNRLDQFVQKYGLVQNGKIVKTDQTISFNDRQNISSILDYLIRTKRDKHIRSWMNTPPMENEYFSGTSVVEEMGFEYVSSYMREDGGSQEHISYYDRNNYGSTQIQDVRGYGYILQADISDYEDQEDAPKIWAADAASGLPGIKASLSDQKVFSIAVDGYAPISFDIAAEIYDDAARGSLGARDDIIFEATQSGLKLQLKVLSLNGQFKDDQVKIHYVSFQMMVGVQ